MKTIKYKVTKFEDGREEWRVDGILHREDGPALKYSNGSEYWYKNGNYHREDGPAVKRSDGTEEWYKNGKLHREDGPAVKYTDGIVGYYLEGNLLNKKQFKSRTKKSNSCECKVVEIDGVKYKLIKL